MGKSGIARVIGTACLFFLGASFLLPSPTLSEEISIPNEAIAKWAQYVEFAKRLQGSYFETVVDHLNNDEVRARNRVELRVRGHAMAYSFQFLGPNPEPKQRWYVRNESYGFELERRLDTDPWVLSRLIEEASTGQNSGILSEVLNDGATRTFVPLRVKGRWLPDMVQESEFGILGLAKVEEAGRTMTRITFKYTKPKQGQWDVETGWILLEPALYWVVRKYEVNVRWRTGDTGKVSYQADFKLARDSIPLLTRSVEKIESPGPLEKTSAESRIEYTVDDSEPAPDQFTLSAFGLPEIPSLRRKGFPRQLGFAAGALVLLAAAVTFWLRSRRGRTRAEPS